MAVAAAPRLVDTHLEAPHLVDLATAVGVDTHQVVTHTEEETPITAGEVAVIGITADTMVMEVGVWALVLVGRGMATMAVPTTIHLAITDHQSCIARLRNPDQPHWYDR